MQRNQGPTDGEIVAEVRNLDHIGGGNLLRSLYERSSDNRFRNLDHIGGGNLLRRASRSEPLRSDQLKSALLAIGGN